MGVSYRSVILALSSPTCTPPQNNGGGLLVKFAPTNLLPSVHTSNHQYYYYYYYGCNNNGINYRGTRRSAAAKLVVSAKSSEEEGEAPKKRKQNVFESVTEALDFAQVRSEEDAQLLEEAREATKSGSKMTREQYGALRRKIGGTYKDFFKSYIDVEGPYVEEGWVDKTCKVCNKDTSSEPRQVDAFGRYAHLACLNNKKPKSGGNFFTRLFS